LSQFLSEASRGNSFFRRGDESGSFEITEIEEFTPSAWSSSKARENAVDRQLDSTSIPPVFLAIATKSLN
jgi:hypothetical protein